MRRYYKRIDKSDYIFKNAPIALKKSYEALKTKDGAIVSSDDKGEFILIPSEVLDEFVPTTISREDLKAQGFDADSMTDENVQDIADEMGELWVGFGDYWEQMDACAEKLGFEKSEEDEEDEE
jgi:hypothetical protein